MATGWEPGGGGIKAYHKRYIYIETNVCISCLKNGVHTTNINIAVLETLYTLITR